MGNLPEKEEESLILYSKDSKRKSSKLEQMPARVRLKTREIIEECCHLLSVS